MDLHDLPFSSRSLFTFAYSTRCCTVVDLTSVVLHMLPAAVGLARATSDSENEPLCIITQHHQCLLFPVITSRKLKYTTKLGYISRTSLHRANRNAHQAAVATVSTFSAPHKAEG